MSGAIFADELQRQIIFMQQDLIIKRKVLEEYRQKYNSEIASHGETKSIVSKYLNENKELHKQLELSLSAAQKLEEENDKNRELLFKLQIQEDAYLNERKIIVDKCYLAEVENTALKHEITELKEQLKAHNGLEENYKMRQAKTQFVINEIIAKQEALNREHARLELVCKESLQFSEKLSEEANFYRKFIQEANVGHLKMERELTRLMALIRQLELENEKYKRGNIPEVPTQDYLAEWKSYQKAMEERNQEMQANINRLVQELTFATEQVETLMKTSCEGE